MLDLSDNFLDTDLHENLAGLDSLEVLNFSGNSGFRMKKIHSKFLMSKISELNLDGTCLGYQGLVDVLSFSGENLVILSVKNCELKKLPDLPVWGNACGLRKLDFQKNMLKNVPEIVFQALLNLEILDLTGNKLQGKNPLAGVKNCSKLVELQVSGNKINRLETILLELRGLRNLEILDFGDNPVEGAFLGRDIGLMVELQRQVFAVRKIEKFVKGKKMIRRFRRTVQLAREKSAGEGKGKKGKKGKKGSEKKGSKQKK